MRRTVASCGAVVVTESDSAALSASLGVWIGVGSRDEPDELAGSAHLLEHMLFRGTEQRDSRELNTAIERLGGELNAFTSKEHTAFTCHVPASTVADGCDLLLELVAQPRLDGAEVQSERAVVLEELAAVDDVPDDLAFTELYRQIFAGHPLARDVLGTHDSLVELDDVALRTFYDRWYRGGCSVVAATGAVDHDELVAAVDRYLLPGPAGSAVHPVRSGPADLDQPTELLVERPLEQVHRCWGWRALPSRHLDRFALAVVNHALGGGVSSRLYHEVREQRGLAYVISSGTQAFTDCGVLSVYAAAGPDGADELAEVVEEVLAGFLDGVTDEELEVAKGALWGSTILALDDPGARMGRLALGELSGHGPEPLDDVARSIAEVSHDDARRVAEQILGSPRVSLTLGPGDALESGGQHG